MKHETPPVDHQSLDLISKILGRKVGTEETLTDEDREKLTEAYRAMAQKRREAMHMRKVLVVLLGLFVLAGCCSTPEADAVARERGVIKVWRERSLKYSAADAALTEAQKADDVRYWDAFESWVKDREEALAK